MTRKKLSATVSSVIAAMTLVGCSGNVQNAVDVDPKNNKAITADDQTAFKLAAAEILTVEFDDGTEPRVNVIKPERGSTTKTVVKPTPKLVKRTPVKQAQTPYREDTWRQIYRGFRIPNYNREPRVQQFINKFSRHPKHLTRMSERANPYLPYVVEEIRKRGMPSELALLPFVESSFRPHAYSHAHAAGLWQFIPETGRRYGLKQTPAFDGRYDPFLATKAALGYLKDLNRQFNGDWLLALAGYNCGENRVQREIDKNRAAGRPTDFWNLDLPEETRQYVPRLLAYKEIYRQPARYRLTLPERNPRSEPIRTNVNKAIDLRKVAQHAGLPSNTLTRINLAYKTGISTPDIQKGEINLPRPHANRLLKIIRGIPELPDSVVQQANRKAKKKVVIAQAKRKAKKKVVIASAKKIKKSSRKKSSKKSIRAKKPQQRIVMHRVRRGETLVRIAKRYGVSIHRIMRMNKLRSTRLKAGKRLKVNVKSRRG